MSRIVSISDEAYSVITAAAMLRGQTPEAFLEALAIQYAHDPGQAWFWTPEWQAGEQRATAERDAGQGEYFEDEDAFIAALDEINVSTRCQSATPLRSPPSSPCVLA
ncbi:MAG TPA: hypothetical protein VF120_14725 [Ktedonobacterales bacterium]